MQQRRRGVHPGAGPNRTGDALAHHALVETRVAWVNLHEQIRDTMDLEGEQKGDSVQYRRSIMVRINPGSPKI